MRPYSVRRRSRPSPGALWALHVEPDVPAIAPGVGHKDPAGASSAVAQVGVNPTLDGRALHDALRPTCSGLANGADCSFDAKKFHPLDHQS
jgi:hypothetical protein